MRIIGFTISIFWSVVLSAQSFSAWPSAVLAQELAFNEANECFIYFEHPGIDTLHLRWRQVETSLPDGWSADLCDYGLCYTGIPANGTMNPAIGTVPPYLKLIVQPGALPGSAWVWFRVSEVENSDNYVDVYYNLYTPGTTSVQAPTNGALRVFPNPVRSMLYIENRGKTEIPVRLTDISGKEIMRTSLLQTTEAIDLTPYPPGSYLLQTPEKTERIFKQ